MIGIYFNETESKLMIPLLIKKINDAYAFREFDSLDVYQEILGRIYAALKIGCLNTDIYGD